MYNNIFPAGRPHRKKARELSGRNDKNMKKIFIGIVSAVVVVVVGYAIYVNFNKPAPITQPLQITIYCANNNCASQQIMAGAGTLIQGCSRDLNTCLTYNWKTHTDSQGMAEFRYPESFGETVWRPTVWPPKLTIVPGTQDSLALGCPNVQADIATKKDLMINNINYSYYLMSDAGAGSVYNDYCYVTQKDQNYYVMDFSIRYHAGCYNGGCGAYCGTEYETECRNFDLARDVEALISLMMSTFTFLK
jgi:hypothetical protein